MAPCQQVTNAIKIGEGSFGDVFRADFLSTKVALKTGKEVTAGSPSSHTHPHTSQVNTERPHLFMLADMFTEATVEYAMQSQVSHPNIVQASCYRSRTPTMQFLFVPVTAAHS